jgi:hypothetical protein
MLLAIFLSHPAIEARQLSGASKTIDAPQIKQVRKTKKKKKRIVKKTVKKNNTAEAAEGVWGGTGIGLTIGAESVKIEYDCAEAEIKQKFVTDAGGNFNLDGFYKRQPPMIRVDMVVKPQAANFQGVIDGSTMRLKVTLTETKQLIGEYTLKRGEDPELRKCR